MATAANQARIILTADDQSAAAFAAISRRFDGLKGQVEGIKGRFDAVIGTATAVLATIGAAHKIELLDQLDKLSEKTGLTVEQLSVLRYQSELASVPFDDLTKGIQKFAKTLGAAAGGNAEAVATFKAMGISVKDNSGAVKGFDQLLGEVADKFSHYEDGPLKAALAQRVFGKSGAELIPLLNQGSEGLARQRKEAEELGIVLGGNLAKNASEFNDNMTRLRLTSEAAAIAIGGQLLPALNNLLHNYLEFKKEGLLGAVVKDAAKDVLGLGQLTDDPGADLQAFAKERKRLLKDLAFAQKHDLGTRDIEDALVDNSNLSALSHIKQRTKALGELGDVSDAVSRRMRAGVKTEAPVVPDTGAGDKAEAVLKRQLEQRLKSIQDFSALQKLAIEFDNQQAESLYAAGFLSVNELFDRQNQARDADLKNQLDEFAKTIAAEQAFIKKAKDPADIVHAQTAINEAQAKGVKAQAEYEFKKVQSLETERSAIQRVKDSYADLNATILDLAGNSRDAAKARIDKQVRDAAITVGQAGGDPKLVAEYKRRLETAADIADVQKRYNQLLAKTGDEEEAITLAAQANGATELDTLNQIGAVRADALGQLRDMAIAAAELSKQSNNPDDIAFARKLALAFAKASSEVDPIFTRIRDIGKEMGDAAANDAEQAIEHWQGFRNLLGAIEKDIIRIATRKLFTEPAGNWLGNALGGNGQASGGGGILGSYFGKLLGMGGGASNVGGTSVWGGAPGGDYAGLSQIGNLGADFFLPGLATGTDYVPQDMLAMLHQGEAVVPKKFNGGAMGMTVVINQSFAAGTSTATINQAAQAAGQAVALAQRRNG